MTTGVRMERILLKIISYIDIAKRWSVTPLDTNAAGSISRSRQFWEGVMYGVARLCLGVAYVVLGSETRARAIADRMRHRIFVMVAKKSWQKVAPSGEGLRIIGFLKSETGIGESARSTLRAARKVDIDVSFTDLPEEGVRRREAFEECPDKTRHYDINLVHLNPNAIPSHWTILQEHFSGCYNIGYWVWEVSRLRDNWIHAFSLFDEIWTPSKHSQDIFRRYCSLPVIRIPHNVVPDLSCNIDREFLGLPREGFCFLCMCDFVSTAERKNPLGVLEAYTRAFGSRPDKVHLILKTIHSNHRPKMMKRIRQYVDTNPSIIVIDGYLDRPVLNCLTNSCDCLVSLHRSEGFGLPLAEAMYMGKPVIATGWSGNMDFMNERNSLPVRYRIVELETDVYPFRKGSEWAEPDLDHAAELMRLVVADNELRNRLGRKAMEDIRTGFSPEASGRLMLRRLSQIRVIDQPRV